MKKDTAIQFQKNLSVPWEDKTPIHSVCFISLGCVSSVAKPLQNCFGFSHPQMERKNQSGSEWPRRQELSVFLSPVPITYTLALSWMSLCLGCPSLPLSLLHPCLP